MEKTDYTKLRELATWGEDKLDWIKSMQDLLLDKGIDQETKDILLSLNNLMANIEEYNQMCEGALKTL